MSLNVLVVDRSPPVDRRQGNSLIGAEIFARLKEHRLTLVAPATDEERNGAALLHDLFDEVVLVPRRARVPALAGSVEANATRLPGAPWLDLPAARAVQREVTALARRQSFDVVHVRQLPMAWYARDVRAGRLLELIDSETLGAERALPRTGRVRLRAQIARRIERLAMRGYDVVTVVGQADADRLRAIDPARRVEVVPNGVDLERFRPLSGVRPEPGLLVFVGAMSFPPNVVAMQFFCTEVLPRVRAECADARLLIVGRDPADAVLALGTHAGVEVVGEVDDVGTYLARAAVFVAPILSGSGIKNKVLEAFAVSRPVVATSLAVEGLPVSDGREARVADGADAFARAIVDLLADPAAAERIGAAGRGLVEDRYTWEACADRYRRLYEDLAALRRAAPALSSAS
jgi:glycosyltransferase involved in cell wall biosynthesis